nr:NERD domain-containing protein [uncultured Niameybacter sp.]
MLLLLLIILCGIAISWYQNYTFKKTTYYKITHNSFISTRCDLGRNGEYLTYKYLQSYENKGGKFLFNCYLPKDNGETTEIDVILINEDGVFCFESKNYSGWIFGDEKAKNWTQTLPKGKGRSHKEYFLNPIIQNKVHIKWLKKQIGENIPVHSVIVFSERCTLKKVHIESPDIYVINRNKILSTVREIGNRQNQKLTTQTINSLYDSLYPYTQVSGVVKEQHIDNIQNNKVDKCNNVTANNFRPEKRKKEDGKVQNQLNEIKVDSSNLCPKCGSELVLRIAKRGDNSGKQFYGCSSYPKCKFIRNL